jgi:hypothetical protein
MPPIRNSSSNLLLNRLSYDDGFHIEELIPPLDTTENDLSLIWDASGNILWKEQKRPSDIHGVHLDGSRIGIGRKPLFTYKVDIDAPIDHRCTALHIGDGLCGFSMGNGTYDGFVPEIIGMGSTEKDPGLYFIGKTSSTLPSNVPLIVIDGRQGNNMPLTNRPIFGIANGNYTEYELLVGHDGNVGIGKYPGIYKMEVNGTIRAKDVVTDSSISLLSLKQEIDHLKSQLQLIKK